MIRLLAIFLLAVGFCGLGVCGAGCLKSRVKELRELIVGLEAIKRELKYSMAPLSELLECAGQETVGEIQLLFTDCSDRVGAAMGESFQYVLKQSLAQRSLCLKQADLVILERMGSILGRYDAEEQIKSLEHTVLQLEGQYGQAVDESARLGRVYTVLGFAAGMFTLILFV